MGYQFGDRLLHLFLSGGILGQGRGLKCRKKPLPDRIQFALHVAGIGRDGDHRILVGNHHAELAGRAVTAKGAVGAAQN